MRHFLLLYNLSCCRGAQIFIKVEKKLQITVNKGIFFCTFSKDVFSNTRHFLSAMQLSVSLIEVSISRASYGNHAEVVNFLLLFAGADLSARTADGWTPLHSAARWNAFACVEILLAQVQFPMTMSSVDLRIYDINGTFFHKSTSF